jgi:hypothetical protein
MLHLIRCVACCRNNPAALQAGIETDRNDLFLHCPIDLGKSHEQIDVRLFVKLPPSRRAV